MASVRAVAARAAATAASAAAEAAHLVVLAALAAAEAAAAAAGPAEEPAEEVPLDRAPEEGAEWQPEPETAPVLEAVPWAAVLKEFSPKIGSLGGASAEDRIQAAYAWGLGVAEWFAGRNVAQPAAAGLVGPHRVWLLLSSEGYCRWGRTKAKVQLERRRISSASSSPIVVGAASQAELGALVSGLAKDAVLLEIQK